MYIKKKVIIGYELVSFSMDHFFWLITQKNWNMGGSCQGHQKTQEQRLKEKSKSSFQKGTRQDYMIQK